MNLQQLRALCEVVRQGLHFSDAANALFRSQPGVSRQIRSLEKELGTSIFVRNRNKVMGLTEPGQLIVDMARRALSETENMHRVGGEFEKHKEGSLTVATTHTQARYTLPNVVKSFVTRYPEVQLSLRQGTASQCYEYVDAGEVDLAIATEIPTANQNVVSIPAYRLPRSIVMPPKHPLLKEKQPTLASIAKYPLIINESGYGGRWIVESAFSRHGLTPRIVVNAMDSDVSKTYVELGLGIAILTNAAIDRRRDTHLRVVDASHLFAASLLNVIVMKRAYLRSYAMDFILLFAPHISPDEFRRYVEGAARPGLRHQKEIPGLS